MVQTNTNMAKRQLSLSVSMAAKAIMEGRASIRRPKKTNRSSMNSKSSILTLPSLPSLPTQAREKSSILPSSSQFKLPKPQATERLSILTNLSNRKRLYLAGNSKTTLMKSKTNTTSSMCTLLTRRP